jgi:hypothetical protein
MKRVFIVVLVVFALLYLAALAVGFHMNARKAPSGVSATADNWVAGATGWLFGFGPRLDLSRLSCDGQPADRGITLTQAKTSCVMHIPAVGADGPKYRKASLRASGAGVYVWASFQKDGPFKQGADPNCLPPETPLPAGLKLKVKYEPGKKQEGEMWNCWLHKPPKEAVDLVALKEGGTLTLTCEGCCEHCDPRGPRVLQLRME